MKNIAFLLLGFALLFTACLNDEDWFTADKTIKSVKSEMVPDARVALFEVVPVQIGDTLLLKGETNLPEAKTLLLQRMQNAGLPVRDSILVLPSANLMGKHFGVVRLSVGNMRSKPKHSAELSTQALLGTPLRVWKKMDDWYLVQTPDGYLGWMDEHGFTPMNEAELTDWQQAPKWVVTEKDPASWFVYAQTQTDGPIVMDLTLGSILRQNGTATKGMQPVRLPDGRAGFVKTNGLLPYDTWVEQSLPDSTELLATAYRMFGAPYLWGGTSAKGMDCSGFTKTVFFRNGILLPRDASQQVHVGRTVETDTVHFSNLLPGDLLYFGRAAKEEQPEKIWHVGIYVGEGRMIHAAGEVKVNSLIRGETDFAEDRLLTFVRAKRLIEADSTTAGVEVLKNSAWY